MNSFSDAQIFNVLAFEAILLTFSCMKLSLTLLTPRAWGVVLVCPIGFYYYQLNQYGSY